jgi:hypothetical protein
MNRLGVHRSVRILVAATQENGVGVDLRRVRDALRLGRLNQFLRGLTNEACFTVWSAGPGLPKASWGTALRGEIVSAPGCAGKGIAIGFSARREKPNCGRYERFDCVNFSLKRNRVSRRTRKKNEQTI